MKLTINKIIDKDKLTDLLPFIKNYSPILDFTDKPIDTESIAKLETQRKYYWTLKSISELELVI